LLLVLIMLFLEKMSQALNIFLVLPNHQAQLILLAERLSLAP